MIENIVNSLITWLFTPSANKEPRNIQVPNPTAANYANVAKWLSKQYQPRIIGLYYQEAKKRNASPDVLNAIANSLRAVSTPSEIRAWLD